MSTSLIDSVANTTSHRDRDDLDRAIATLLLQFLEADAVTLYRLSDTGETKYVRRGITTTRGNDEPAAAPPASELIEVDSVPAWRECISEQKAVQFAHHGGKYCTVFPIANERAVVGMLEIETTVSLQQRDTHLVAGVLRIV